MDVSGEPPPTMLVIGHETTLETVLVQGGTLVEWATDRGFAVRPAVAGPVEGSTSSGRRGPTMDSAGPMPDPAGPESPDVIVVLGSLQGAWDDSVPWLADEIAYLGEAVRHDVPILGICFGGQLLARVLGGTVAPGTRSENGWSTIRTEVPDMIAPGPWMEFHFDVFSSPPGSRRLASSDLCDQAFRLGQHVGLQFHPEVTVPSVQTWVDHWTGTEFEARLPSLGVTSQGLLDDTARLGARSREASRVIYDAFLEGSTA